MLVFCKFSRTKKMLEYLRYQLRLPTYFKRKNLAPKPVLNSVENLTLQDFFTFWKSVFLFICSGSDFWLLELPCICSCFCIPVDTDVKKNLNLLNTFPTNSSYTRQGCTGKFYCRFEGTNRSSCDYKVN